MKHFKLFMIALLTTAALRSMSTAELQGMDTKSLEATYQSVRRTLPFYESILKKVQESIKTGKTITDEYAGSITPEMAREGLSQAKADVENHRLLLKQIGGELKARRK